MSPFEDLLKELGHFLKLELHVDQAHACSILIKAHLTVQLQLDTAQENLWIFAKISETPPGKFRENILKETLKANALPDPRSGTFGYVNATNELALFQKFPLSVLNGERLAGLIGALVEMATNWQEAIRSGQSAPFKQEEQSNPFGLK